MIISPYFIVNHITEIGIMTIVFTMISILCVIACNVLDKHKNEIDEDANYKGIAKFIVICVCIFDISVIMCVYLSITGIQHGYF